MDATTLGAVLACVGVLSGSVVAYIGKRGENGLLRFDQVQEERDRKDAQLAASQAEVNALHQQRHADLVRMTRLEIQIIRLGEEPVP